MNQTINRTIAAEIQIVEREITDLCEAWDAANDAMTGGVRGSRDGRQMGPAIVAGVSFDNKQRALGVRYAEKI
jgi:hypothetical protein